jgi:DNA-binding response OmpR family regulator
MTTQAATILIVEDDAEISRLVADFMRREGFEVVCAGDGGAMNTALQRLRPDLIILDLCCPGRTACRSAAGCARTTTSRS